MRLIVRLVLLSGVFVSLTAAVPDPAQGQTVGDEIKARVEQLRVAGRLTVAGVALDAGDGLAELYERRGFEPVWDRQESAAGLTRALVDARRDGLDPADYHVAVLEALAAVSRTVGERAEIDLLRTAAMVRLARDLSLGRVGPPGGEPRSGISWDPVATTETLLASGSVEAGLDALRPRHFVYARLVEALAALRAIEAAGGWPNVPAGPTVRVGDADERVRTLKARLAVGGDLRAPTDGLVFDAGLEEAVRLFQHRHALLEDGIVGAATLAELNVPVGQRIDQVRVNLERARWILHDLPDRFVTVNIAGAMVYLIRAGDPVFEARAVVGATYTRTPVFTAPMRYIDLNPTWTVPPGIVGEVLSSVRRDAGWLGREGMRVLDRSGARVDPNTIDFARYGARSFPYMFRQDPGPRNPLGRIKFVFPNGYNVYLHDTPSRQLFEREQRTFSHGCIRVENPVDLAVAVLDDPVRWSADSIRAAIEEGATRTIRLQDPLPVLVLYWTAAADLHGELHFYRDVYGRDAAILEALDR